MLGELEKVLRLSANKDLTLKQYDYCYIYSKIKASNKHTQKKIRQERRGQDPVGKTSQRACFLIRALENNQTSFKWRKQLEKQLEQKEVKEHRTFWWFVVLPQNVGEGGEGRRERLEQKEVTRNLGWGSGWRQFVKAHNSLVVLCIN